MFGRKRREAELAELLEVLHEERVAYAKKNLAAMFGRYDTPFIAVRTDTSEGVRTVVLVTEVNAADMSFRGMVLAGRTRQGDSFPNNDNKRFVMDAFCIDRNKTEKLKSIMEIDRS